MIFAWVCVDQGGEEYICGDLPERVSDEMDGVEMEYWFTENMVEVPIGTIKKIIGKDLTWNDDPVELED